MFQYAEFRYFTVMKITFSENLVIIKHCYKYIFKLNIEIILIQDGVLIF